MLADIRVHPIIHHMVQLFVLLSDTCHFRGGQWTRNSVRSPAASCFSHWPTFSGCLLTCPSGQPSRPVGRGNDTPLAVRGVRECPEHDLEGAALHQPWSTGLWSSFNSRRCAVVRTVSDALVGLSNIAVVRIPPLCLGQWKLHSRKRSELAHLGTGCFAKGYGVLDFFRGGDETRRF